MQHIQCTGVLVECGFISNPEEEAKLRSEDYQQKISCVIAAACGRFLHGSAEI
jgi:N-acetylmuramoyl-L-alanine amidase